MEDVLPRVIESGASTGGARPKQRIAISENNPDQIWTAAVKWPTISESLKISPTRSTEIQQTWEPVV